MIDNLIITRRINLTVSVLVVVAVMISCKGQDKKPGYNPKAIEFNNKAVRLVQGMKYDSALMLFNKAIEIDENYYLPHSNMASIYLRRKQFDEALKASVKAVEVKPDFAEGWVFAGMLYHRQGDSLTAKEYYKKSVGIYDERINDPGKKDQVTVNRLNRAFSLINKQGIIFRIIQAGKQSTRMIFDAHVFHFHKGYSCQADHQDN